MSSTPAGSVGSASSHACRSHPRCARCAACPSTPRRWTRPPTWRSSSHPTRHPAGAVARRYSPRVPSGPGECLGPGFALQQRSWALPFPVEDPAALLDPSLTALSTSGGSASGPALHPPTPLSGLGSGLLVCLVADAGTWAGLKPTQHSLDTPVIRCSPGH